MEEFKLNVVKMLKIEKPYLPKDRDIEEAPKVDPKVAPKQAIEALRRYEGGAEIIEMLKKEGKTI